MPEDRVSDDEQLYRSVQNKGELYSNVGGKLRLSASVFNDKHEKPSVDRAILRNDPSESKLSATDGIVLLIAQEVRAIDTVKHEGTDKKKDPSLTYAFDVIARPILAGNAEGRPANLAHAQIEVQPEFKTTTRFRKLKEALALLAAEHGWVIEPS